MKRITYRQFDSACKRAERAALRQHGTATSAVTLGQNSTLMRHGARIVAIHPDSKTMDVEGDWRAAIRSAALEYCGSAASTVRRRTTK